MCSNGTALIMITHHLITKFSGTFQVLVLLAASLQVESVSHLLWLCNASVFQMSSLSLTIHSQFPS